MNPRGELLGQTGRADAGLAGEQHDLEAAGNASFPCIDELLEQAGSAA